MKTLNLLAPAMAIALLAGYAHAQNETTSTADLAERRAMERGDDEVMQRLSAAEARMAEAAREIAELTSRRLPQMQQFERQIEFIADNKPRLGVTIGGDEDGPVEGVSIVGVTPGSAASESGLRAGDVITSINSESLSAGDAETATRRLLDIMAGIEEGDTLDVEYLRDGKVGKVEVEPKPVAARRFVFAGPGPAGAPHVPDHPGVHALPRIADGLQEHFVFDWTSDAWGDMELVELSEGLGRYFGTDEGLLVVSAPDSGTFKLEDGDVIQKIDGREPISVRHAMRILASYQAGEKLQLEIMRDKKRRTLDIEIPDDLQGRLLPGIAPAVRPATAPVAPLPAGPAERA